MQEKTEREKRIEAGKRLRYLRLKILNLTQLELAESLGSNQNFISRMEHGHDPIGSSTLLKLARLHKVNPQYLEGTSTKPLTEPEKEDAGSTYVKALVDEMPPIKNNVHGNLVYVPVRQQPAFLQVGIKAGDRISFPILPGACIGFEIGDDAMAPEFRRGCTVVCTVVDKKYFINNKVYMVQTADALLLRKIVLREKQEIVLLDTAENELVLPTDQIEKLYHLELKIDRV